MIFKVRQTPPPKEQLGLWKRGPGDRMGVCLPRARRGGGM